MGKVLSPPLAGTRLPAADVFERDLVVVSNDPVNGEYMRLALKAPLELLERCRAGQFGEFRGGGHGRRWRQ